MRSNRFYLAVFVSCFALSSTSAHAEQIKFWTLGELIAAAQTGPRAQAANQRTQEAHGARTEARGSRGPRISLQGILAPSPSIDCIDAACTETDPSDPSISASGVFGRVELSLVQPLYTFGKISAATKASGHAIEAARSLEDANAGVVAVEAARAYFGLKLARESRWMLEDGKERLGKALQKVNDALAAGSSEATLQDRFRLETLSAEVEIRLADAIAAEHVALAGVRALASDANGDIDDDPLEPLAYTAGPDSNVIARALASKPEVRAAAAGTEIANGLEHLEAAKYWPDLLLVGSVTLARATSVDDAPSAFASDPYNTVSAAAALALRWKFEPFSQRGRVAQAKARTRRANHTSQAARRQASFQAKEAHADLERAGKRLAISRKGERSAKAWVASALQAEAVGALESKDLADAYLALFSARARTLEAINDWNLAVFEIRRVLGEFVARPGV